MKEDIVLNKNEECIVTIEDMGNDGEGIGKYKGYTLFVKNALVGDRVRVRAMKCKKNYGYARLMEIIEPSPYRVEPKCSIAFQCGGCTLQHLDYKEQLHRKQKKVTDCIERIGGITQGYTLYPIIGMEEPYYYRNKAQFPVRRNKDGKIAIGFYASGTHSIIDTEHCCIQAKENEDIIRIIRSFLEEENISIYEEEAHKGLVRHILTRVGYITREIMVCLVINGNNLPHKDKLIEKLKEVPDMKSISLNINKEMTNVILGEKVIGLWDTTSDTAVKETKLSVTAPYITDYIGDVKFRISPLSFYQVNPVQTKVLYEKALEFADLKGDETVWDLYCGIGTISLFLAAKAKQVYGVEIIPQAIEDARENAKLNGIENAEFFVGAAEEVFPKKYKEEQLYAEVIVVDPPRKGCEESLLDTIVTMAPKRIVYVSCDPATLGRDIKYLCGRGYELKKVQPVDQFSHTGHVETCVLLSHKNPQTSLRSL